MKRTFLSGLLLILVGIGLLRASAPRLITEIPSLERFLRCATPNLLNAGHCRRVEEQILKATVRLVIRTWKLADDQKGYVLDVSSAHATVKDGRYLITHNHFSFPLSIRRGERSPGFGSTVLLFDTEGILLGRIPLSDFEVVVDEREILVLAHRDAHFFARFGLASAAFKGADVLPRIEGVEVAQIDWDGETTRVDWTTVQAAREIEGTPVLDLDDGVLPGASGGGIYWNGYHIANIWRFEEKLDAAGDLVDIKTIVALNTASVLQ